MARARSRPIREVPKGTRLHQLKKIGGFDLGLYYHEDETHKWDQNLEKFERLVTVMTEQLNRMKIEKLAEEAKEAAEKAKKVGE